MKTHQKRMLGLLKTGQAGFSLMEIMIVIAILGLLGTFVATKVMSRFTEAKVDSTKIQMRQLGTVLDDFYRVCGFYPLTDQGLDALIKKPEGRDCKNYDPDGFLKDNKIPNDGFGYDFLYTSDGTKYQVKSLGNDNKEGGNGPDADIASDNI